MEENNQKKSSRILITCVILLFFVLGFGSGYFLNSWSNLQQSTDIAIKKEIVNKSTDKDINEKIDFNLFWQVWDIIKKNALEQPVDETKMFYGALTGMTASLGDPYSIFLDPELTKSFNETIDGTFEGIGAEIGIKDNHIVIIAPLPGMPAANAGLKAGDSILAIDNLDTTNMSVDYAVKLLRGAKGTQVTLIIQHENEDAKEITITRDIIKVESVKWEMKEMNNKKVGYITIASFGEDTAAKFNEVANKVLLEQPAGIVIDLRNNPGGLLDSSIEIASNFINSGPIVYEQFQDGTKKEYSSLGGAQLEGIETVVLVNGGSASAAEILAGALQDDQIAKIIGEKTFGKGSVQDYQTFPDGSSLKLTVAKWLTPNGRSINETGINPDEVVALTEDDYNNNRDPQLDRALEIISQ